MADIPRVNWILIKHLSGREAARWIGRHQLQITWLSAPVLLFSAAFSTGWILVAWAAVGLPWVCRIIADSRLTRRVASNLPLLALLLVVLFNWLRSTRDDTGAMFLQYFVVGVSIWYGLVNTQSARRGIWLNTGGALALAVALAVTSPFVVTWSSSRFFFEEAYSGLNPVVSESLDANILAAILSMTLILAVSLAWRGQFGYGDRSSMVRIVHWPRIWLVLIGMIILLAQGFSQSRGAAAGLVVGLYTLVVILRRRWLLALPALGLTIYGLSWLVDLRAVAELLLGAGPASGWSGRRDVWISGTYMLRAMPFTGIGMGRFAEIQSLLFPFSEGWQPTHAHNLFLQVGVDLGVPGLVAYVGVLTTCLIMAWRARRYFCDVGDRNLEALSAGVFAALIAMVTHGLVDAPLWGTKPSVVAWFFMGLAAMLYVHSSDELKNAAGSEPDDSPAEAPSTADG